MMACTGLRVAKSGKSQSTPCSLEMRGVTGHFVPRKCAILEGAVFADWKRLQNF
jgi:hypothetical protein